MLGIIDYLEIQSDEHKCVYPLANSNDTPPKNLQLCLLCESGSMMMQDEEVSPYYQETV